MADATAHCVDIELQTSSCTRLQPEDCSSSPARAAQAIEGAARVHFGRAREGYLPPGFPV
jgi:hypothetical protein